MTPKQARVAAFYNKNDLRYHLVVNGRDFVVTESEFAAIEAWFLRNHSENS